MFTQIVIMYYPLNSKYKGRTTQMSLNVTKCFTHALCYYLEFSIGSLKLSHER